MVVGIGFNIITFVTQGAVFFRVNYGATMAFATALGSASAELVTRLQQGETISNRMQLLAGIAVAMLAGMGLVYFGYVILG